MNKQPRTSQPIISFADDTALEVSADMRCALRTVDPAAVLHFPEGLPAFEQIKQFVLIVDEQFKPFLYLQALSDSSLCFVCIEPFVLRPDYCIDIPAAYTRQLQLTSPQDALMLSFVTIGADVRQTTANLMSPVLINLKARLGRQLIPESSKYPVRCPVWDTLVPEAADAEMNAG